MSDERLVSAPGAVVPPDQRGMGMVFQNYAVWPHKTVYENVVFGLKVRRVPGAQARRRVEETLALVNLTGLETRYPNELSGGQQQRVALARSLVVEPGILLLDEPLSNLDAKLRERMRAELKQLQRRTGITFVYVTHDQAEALALSDMIAVMHAGRLQQYGTPHDVYARPANRLVADFMGLVNLVPGKVLNASGGVATVEAGAGLRFDVAVPRGTAAGDAVELAIRPEDIRLHAPEGRNGAAIAKVTDTTFLGNISEYYVTLAAGRRCACRRIRSSGLPSATPLRSRSTPDRPCVSPPLIDTAPGNSQQPGVPTMNRPVSPRSMRRGEEHWTRKGDIRLFLWEKPAAEGVSKAGTILFVHGSSMASQPTFDLQVEGRPDSSAMDWFAARGFDTWCVDMEGYGRSDKARDINFDIANGADDLAAASDYILKTRGSGRCWSTAFRQVRCAPRCSRSGIRTASSGSRSMPSCGPGREARRLRSARRSCPSSRPGTAVRSTALSCPRSSTAIIRGPQRTR